MLFRKFQRVVEAVDKKGNFPAPRRTSATGQWGLASPSEGSSGQGAAASGSNLASPAPAMGSTTGHAQDKGKGKAADEEPPKVITPELRKLLSRNYDVLPRTMVAQKGEGMPTRG
jgi:TBC1 domain family member 15